MSKEPVQNNGSQEEGAPLWVVTFGDLMSLLLCFFVLMLSFSEMDRKKYRLVSGSMAQAFGIQRKAPVFDSPKGEKIIAKDFDQTIVVTRMERKIVKPIVAEIKEDYQDLENLIKVEVGADQTTIRMMGETTFDSGKAVIRKQMKPLLLKIGSVLKSVKGDIIIAGHTDNVSIKGGRFKSNLELSMARAASVAELFLTRTSINPKRISTMGFGEFRPLEPNDTPEGREKNRRVEIIIVPYNK